MTRTQFLPIRGLLAAVLSAALVMLPGFGFAPPSPAQSAPRLSVTSQIGTNKASPSGTTKISVKGSGFQSINKGFGGIYVVFGYIANTPWQPSKGGKGNKDFFYVADSQSKNNNGFQRFVAFPGSNTSDSANGGVISPNGTFELSMVIPGPTFTASTAAGGTTTVNCRQVQCGIITFGAHGVANGRNEAFQPISFGAAASNQQGGGTRDGSAAEVTEKSTIQQVPSSTAPSAAPTAGNPSDTKQESTEQEAVAEQGVGKEAVAAGEATLGLEQKTVIAGRSLGFTGKGFAPGEQVVATLSSGLTAAGPITAGQFGEIAGAVQIPAEMTAGTHKLKLTGAGSTNSVEAEFSVMADAALLTTADNESQPGLRWAFIAATAAAALLFILVLSSLIAGLAQKRAKTQSKKRPPAKKRRRKPSSRAKRPTVSVMTDSHPEPATNNLFQVNHPEQREQV